MKISNRLSDEQRLAVIAGLVTVLFFALLLPVTRVLDRRTDQARPLYDDVLAVAQYEWQQIEDTGQPVPLTLTPGAPDLQTTGLSLDPDTEHVHVTTDGAAGKGYCIEARNSLGDETTTLCFAGTKKPLSVLDDRV